MIMHTYRASPSHSPPKGCRRGYTILFCLERVGIGEKALGPDLPYLDACRVYSKTQGIRTERLLNISTSETKKKGHGHGCVLSVNNVGGKRGRCVRSRPRLVEFAAKKTNDYHGVFNPEISKRRFEINHIPGRY